MVGGYGVIWRAGAGALCQQGGGVQDGEGLAAAIVDLNDCNQRLATLGEPHRQILSRVRCVAWFAIPARLLNSFRRPLARSVQTKQQDEICGNQTGLQPVGHRGATVQHRCKSIGLIDGA